jgi:ParB-like nuclease domain
MCVPLEPEARGVLLKSVPKSLSHLLSQCALSGCLKATCNDGERCRSIDTPKTLPRSAIIVADKVFQWRPPEEDMKGSEEHVRTLVGEIGTGKERKPLDPVLVIAVGQFFYLVDGHHRMDAYHTANWSKPIPVEVFKGSLRDARDEAFSRNYKDKLPMSQEAKSEAAWVRFNEGDLSWSELEERFRVSNGTIARMSKARKALLEANQNPAEVRWRDARSPAPPR